MSAQPLQQPGTDTKVPLVESPDSVRRTPLALVRPAPRRRRRLPFVLFCVGLVAVVVGSILVLNVSVSRTQYRLVSMKAEQRELSQSNEALTEDLNNKGAPQNLAAMARSQHMVPGGRPGTIDLSAGRVTEPAGAAAVADPEEKSSLFVAAPLTPQEQAEAAARQQEERRLAQEHATAVANAQASQAEASSSSPEDSDGKRASDREDPATPVRDAQGGTRSFSTDELNGGTLPGPQDD